jgi:hypothetical protein
MFTSAMVKIFSWWMMEFSILGGDSRLIYKCYRFLIEFNTKQMHILWVACATFEINKKSNKYVPKNVSEESM